MTYSPAPALLPPTRPRRATTVGPAVTVLGVGIAAASLFGLPLASEGRYDYTDYSLIHSVAALANGGRVVDLFNGFHFWWSWGQLTFGIALLVLTAALLAGVASRPLGFVLTVLALVFGVVEVIALARTPTYRAIQQFRTSGEKVLDNASYGTWFGLLGVVVLAAGALITALQARPRVAASSYGPPAQWGTQQPPQPYGAPYRPSNDPPAKRL